VVIPDEEHTLLAEQLAKQMKTEPTVRRGWQPYAGSGAIALSVLRAIPDAHFTVWEPTETGALLIEENAHALGLSNRIKILPPTEQPILSTASSFDVMVSTPPYLPITVEQKYIEVVGPMLQDRRSIVSGEDGLDAMRYLLSNAQQWLKPHAKIWLFATHNHQSAVVELCRRNIAWGITYERTLRATKQKLHSALLSFNPIKT